MERPKATTSGLGGTGGAVPIRNEKGEITMQKVKVHRYVAGKRPKYAPSSDNEEERSEEEIDDQEEETKQVTSHRNANLPDPNLIEQNTAEDRRLKRLNQVENQPRDRTLRHRHIAEPEILKEDDMDIEDEEEEEKVIEEVRIKKEAKEESDEEEVDEDERMRRRAELKKRLLQRQEELLVVEEEQQKEESDDESETDESEYEEEEYSDSEDEIAPRLKPVFVKKTDRVTIQQKELELQKEKELELERERLHMESKKQTKKLIEEEILREKLAEKETDENIKCDFDTDDDENDEQAYEQWKLRELKRTKRYRDEKENAEKEKQEILKIRNMTEEERQAYLKANPKKVTNIQEKGKYKFMQKYYHRGAFYLDEEEEVLKRNVAEPTLEDHFDKTILPKVMQVKNFGMAGRTKYTHLLDQDTTRPDDNPWGNQSFINGKGGGTKQVFDKPVAKKRK